MIWAYDELQMYTFNSVNNLIPKDKTVDDYRFFFLALINSQMYNKYISAKFTNNSKVTVNISKTFLENLPVFLPENKKLLGKLNSEVSKLLAGKGCEKYVDEALLALIQDASKTLTIAA